MTTERLVKWSKESKEFFEKAEDNSLDLDLVISYGCASQTGEGFEELVNTINSPEIKRKVKKVVITDTSYLYRYLTSQFSGYCDSNIPTEWYIKNKESIEKLTVPTELKSWASGVETDEFKSWHRQIKKDFCQEAKFKEAVIEKASEVFYKSGDDEDLGNNINFILEETAYTCLNFRNSNLVYPMPLLSRPVDIAIEKYKLNINHMDYKISWYAQEHKAVILDRNKVNNEIIKFMTQQVSNVNFFVIDSQGNFIYKNDYQSKIVAESNAKELDQITWTNTVKVIKQKRQFVFEEADKGKTFLSVKSPLVINGKVEGVIGLSIDITDRKRAEELERKLAIEKGLYAMADGFVQGICCPMSLSEIVEYVRPDSKKPGQEREMYISSLKTLKGITGRILSKIQEYEREGKWKEKN